MLFFVPNHGEYTKEEIYKTFPIPLNAQVTYIPIQLYIQSVK